MSTNTTRNKRKKYSVICRYLQTACCDGIGIYWCYPYTRLYCKWSVMKIKIMTCNTFEPANRWFYILFELPFRYCCKNARKGSMYTIRNVKYNIYLKQFVNLTSIKLAYNLYFVCKKNTFGYKIRKYKQNMSNLMARKYTSSIN